LTFQPSLLDTALIPDAVLKDPALSDSARLLLVILAEYQGKGAECFPLQETLAGFLGVGCSSAPKLHQRACELHAGESAKAISPNRSEAGLGGEGAED
jgi:hypothetical protein